MKSSGTSTYERLIDAAAELFATQGYDATTTRQIAAKAGSSLSTIQAHFQSKELLYRAVLERASDKFYSINAPVLDEIDALDRKGILRGEVAWDRIAELTGQIVEWAFNDEFYYEIKVINIEYLRMQKGGKSLESVFRLYETLELLFERYTGRENEPWMHMLSFTFISTAFDSANYRNVLSELTGLDMELPENRREVKSFLKNYLLTSLRANLEQYR